MDCRLHSSVLLRLLLLDRIIYPLWWRIACSFFVVSTFVPTSTSQVGVEVAYLDSVDTSSTSVLKVGIGEALVGIGKYV
jgi:hypothetical protein